MRHPGRRPRAGGACETVVDGITGVLVEDGSPGGFAEGLTRVQTLSFDPAAIRANAERFSRERFMTDFQTAVSRRDCRQGGPAMMRRYNRLLVAFYVVSDAVLGHGRVRPRLHSPLSRPDRPSFPRPRACPPFEQYLNMLPFIGLIVPVAFHVQGLYRLRRGRSRVDDFFAVFVGTILAVDPGPLRHVVLPGVLAAGCAEGPGHLRGLAARSGRCS